MLPMINIRVILLLLLLIQIKCAFGSRRKLNLEVAKTTCHSFTNLMQQYDCKLEHVGTNTYAFTNHLIMSRDVENPFEIRLRIDLQHLNVKSQANLIDARVDGCKVLKTAFDFSLFRTLVDELRRTSNIPYKCPLKAGKLYRVDNFTVSTEILPPYTPNLNFTFTVEYFENNLLFADQLVYGRVFSETPKMRIG